MTLVEMACVAIVLWATIIAALCAALWKTR
jgi:hypothetical protein